MTPPRTLIVNADDLGYTPATNDGIFHAYQHGIVTSASLMVRPDAAHEAVQRAAEIGFTDLGLHLDLAEWTRRNGEWVALYEVVDPTDAGAVAGECERQLASFREMTGRDPMHLDSHQHVHREEPVRSIALAIAERLSIPLRHFSRHVAYRGDFYGQSGSGEAAPELLTETALLDILRDTLRGTEADAVEIGCHPGWDPDLETMYCQERLREVEVLCSPSLRASIAGLGFHLATFSDLAPHPVAGEAS
jgi:predicted glycoside hydrolase/deacetylase ChbG (UPF0249 family)